MSLELPPPVSEAPTPWNWVRKNLFSTWYNSILTIVCLVAIFQGLRGLLVWATTKAQWYVISAHLRLFFAGQYPTESIWRLWAIVAIVAFLGSLTWGNLQRQSLRWHRPVSIVGVATVLVVLLPIGLKDRLILAGQIVLVAGGYWLGQQLKPNFSRWLFLAWVFSFPVVFWLLSGGLGLKQVPTANWSGLLLTLLAAVVSIVLSFPIGVLLALGRQSRLPVVRLFSILYIEVIRGLPLIGVLFLAQVMLPLFLPSELRFSGDRLLRAIAGLSLFSAAYLAEDVRGGLQAVPRGQREAARALGLSPPLVVVLVVLPQALRAVIPALVGEFVGLFKETTLLSVFGLLEFLGISLSILANPQFIGRYAEVYLFVGAIYWVFCYSMSSASRRLEAHLDVSQR